jgi:hypothetical protein
MCKPLMYAETFGHAITISRNVELDCFHIVVTNRSKKIYDNLWDGCGVRASLGDALDAAMIESGIVNTEQDNKG